MLWATSYRLASASVAFALGAGCGGNNSQPWDTLPVLDGGGDDATTSGAASSGGGVLPPPAEIGTPTTTADPQTCDEAAQAHTYVGCDYWPTVVANQVWPIFDFAVVVANAGASTATVTVSGTGQAATNQAATVPPGQLVKIYLPWVSSLKGPAFDNCTSSSPLMTSLAGTAFHLTSDVPVTVYQFNALEYRGQGGPPGKQWTTAACPGDTACSDKNSQNYGLTAGCYSFSNDASLLLPSTAMTGNYRVAGHEGVVFAAGTIAPTNSYAAITAIQDGTSVSVRVANGAQVLTGPAGSGITATPGGGTLTLMLNAGEVAELVAGGGSDLSGSIVKASAPVQVITGHPCIYVPPTEPACDHIEESVFPAETLGKDYVVTRPAGPTGGAAPHQVRFYGNFDNTHLTYNPATPPPGCPTTLDAGQVVECGAPACPATANPNTMTTCGTISQDFEVQGDQPFAVGTFTLGAWVVDPDKTEGDPAQSFATAVEQYRSKYVFLAPDDYLVNYVDIVSQSGVTMTLDGASVSTAGQAVGTSGYLVRRVKLGAGQAGAHVLTASQRVGIQVVGYGDDTSYMYPGGLDLVQIAPPPVLK